MSYYPASSSNHICGCHYVVLVDGWQHKRYYLPQVELKSHAIITPVCFTTTLTQTYRNQGKDKLDQVRYTFPLYDGVAVNGYTIRYANKTLKGVVKQKDDAKKTYDQAVERGETAGLLESLPAGIFGVTLGNIPAETDIVVEITYCGELKHDAQIDGLRYTLPTSIAPRWGDYPGELLYSNVVKKGGISITIDIDMATSAIRKVQSPSHPIAVSMGAMSTTPDAHSAPFRPDHASAALTLGSAELAQDFVLQLLVDGISEPRAIVESHPTLPNQRAIMATLVPKFTLKPAHPEIVFIADQSGSMSGSKNDALVKALQVFLKSLPVGVRFNVAAFGSHHQFLWPKSKAYNEANLNAAMAFVQTFQASYGGTEILNPIKTAFKQRLNDLSLEVMLLTDGEIWNEPEVFGYINEQIRDKKVDARVFALGIGGDVSHTLVEGVARAGNGFAQFVTQEEETDRKVVRMLKGALYAHTWNYKMEVHFAGDVDKRADDDDFEIVEKVDECLRLDDQPPAYEDGKEKKKPKILSFFDKSANVDKPAHTDDKDPKDRYAHLPTIDTPKLLQAPADIPPLFPFNRTTAYLLLGPEAPQKPVTSITLKAMSAEGPLELTVPVKNVSSHGVATVHQLAARKAVQDLEEGRGWLQAATTSAKSEKDRVLLKKKYESRFDELVEREAVRLGVHFQVAGKWTSFVAVQENGTDQEGSEKLSEVDTAEDDIPDFAIQHRSGFLAMAAPSGIGSTAKSKKRSSVASFGMAAASSRGGFGGSSRSGGSALFARSAQIPILGGPGRDRMMARRSHGAAPDLAGAPPPPPALQSAPAPFAPQSSAFHDASSTMMMNSMTRPASTGYGMFGSTSIEAKEGAEDEDMEGTATAFDSSAYSEPNPNYTASMHKLISLQNFAGSWTWNAQFLSAIHKPLLTEDEVKGYGKSTSPEAKATLIAIAFLQARVPEEKEVWEMVVEKAKEWLRQHAGLDTTEIERLVLETQNLLSEWDVLYAWRANQA